MRELHLGQRFSLPYEVLIEGQWPKTETKLVPAQVTGLGLPAVRVETDSGEVFIRHARHVRKWIRHNRHV